MWEALPQFFSGVCLSRKRTWTEEVFPVMQQESAGWRSGDDRTEKSASVLKAYISDFFVRLIFIEIIDTGCHIIPQVLSFF